MLCRKVQQKKILGNFKVAYNLQDVTLDENIRVL